MMTHGRLCPVRARNPVRVYHFAALGFHSHVSCRASAICLGVILGVMVPGKNKSTFDPLAAGRQLPKT